MSKISDIMNESVQYIKGVGPAKAELLSRLGIKTTYDLITYYPRNYEDRTNIKKIKDFLIGESVLFIAKVSSRVTTKRIRKNLTIHSFFVNDGTDVANIVVFNQNYITNTIHEDEDFVFFGKVEMNNGRFEISSPEIMPLSKLSMMKGIRPIYSLTKGITNNYLYKLIAPMVSKNLELKEIFSEEFRKKYDLLDINSATKTIHLPNSFGDVERARRRHIFEELYLLELALMSIKTKNINDQGIDFENTDVQEFIELLPFKLTSAQVRTLDEIVNDMRSNIVMNRLVQGDVGSGKTIIAALSMYIAVKSGYQAAIMAPTTILANQHYEDLKVYFDKLGVTIDLITGNTTKKKKQDIIKNLKEGKTQILFGTHAILEDNVEFKNIGIVVTDEQHRFGVKQRMKLNSKGENVDVLVMTATPIPRTLALTLYSDLNVSIIDELPQGRIPIKTNVVYVNDIMESRINAFITKQIDEGRQAYIVCPLIEENEELDLISAKELYEEYKEKVFRKYSVGFLHGKMKNKEKDEIMEKFKNKDIDILVSTTVIEVGVNVPNASVMVIENADRFGLAALHQLRGRVGRGKYQSYCVLKTKNKGKDAIARLKIMESSNNGFEIAEKDLDLRGPGDFFGIRQHGLPEFKLANLLKDIKVLKLAQVAAKETLEKDKDISLSSNSNIKEILMYKFGEQLSNIGG